MWLLLYIIIPSIVIIVVVVIILRKRRLKNNSKLNNNIIDSQYENYFNILKERLARGEISKQEYDKLKKEFD